MHICSSSATPGLFQYARNGMRRAEAMQSAAASKISKGDLDDFADSVIKLQRAEQQFKANSVVFRTAGVLDEYILDIVA
ncbi:MAG: hypothetical protein ACOCX1_00085 [Fimbriimonadaceae bacterium]